MTEGLQFLLWGILLQSLHHDTKCLKKFCQFWWLAPEKPKNNFFANKSVKNHTTEEYREMESRVRC